MNDLELDETSHDLVIQDGTFNLLNEEQRVARQTLTINLLFFQGEWFLDLGIGIPYFGSILAKGASKSFVDSIMRDAISNSYQIRAILSFRSTLTPDSYTIDLFEAETVAGEIVSITNQVII